MNNIYIYSDNGKTKNIIENAETVRAYPEKNSMYYIKDSTLYYYEKEKAPKYRITTVMNTTTLIYVPPMCL